MKYKPFTTDSTKGDKIMNIIDKHLELCERIHKICIDKNKDYGNSASELYKKFGLISYVIRINDKVNRINNIMMNGTAVKDETIEDTLLDLANYCLLARADIELGWEKYCEDDNN